MSTLTAQTILTTITSNGNLQITPTDGMYLKEIDITSNVNTNPSIEQNVTKLLDNNQSNYIITPDNGYDGISNIDIQLQQDLNKKISSFSLNGITVNKNNYSNYIGTSGSGLHIAIEYSTLNNIFRIGDIELVNDPNYPSNRILIPTYQAFSNNLDIIGPNINLNFWFNHTEFHIDIGSNPWILI